jgi:predicted lysophospholipase L1 biosynthesis ABC-type transport system permease subunit
MEDSKVLTALARVLASLARLASTAEMAVARVDASAAMSAASAVSAVARVVASESILLWSVVSAAVRAYLDRKTETIATLRTLGASGRLILWVYLAQIGALTAVGVGTGLILSLAVPYGAGPLLAPLLPMPAVFAAYPAALAEAACA